MPTQPAILGAARLANFRLAYMPADLERQRRYRVRIVLGGVDVTGRVLLHSLTVRDGLNDSPNTCSLTLKGPPAPPDVADLRISVGVDQPTLLFSGTLQTVDGSHVGRQHLRLFPITGIDDTARANRRRPFGKWVGVSATTIATELIARFAPGFTTHHVQPGLPPISVTLDGSEGFAGALRQIAKLIGGYFYFEDLDLHLYQDEVIEPPDPIDLAHRFLADPPIHVVRDFSQLRTRVYGRGLGSPLLSDVAAGEVLLPIDDSVSFNPDGGQAIAESQIIHYTGREIGLYGSLVGPGAAPGNAPVVADAGGVGIEPGPHGWAVSFVTPSGESLPGPIASHTVGVLTPPDKAPVIAPPAMADAANIGVDPGGHYYAVGFVTADGETPPGPIGAVVTTLTPEPLYGPTPTTPTQGVGPDPGSHDYACSFVTPSGETLAGPIGPAIVTGNLPPPTPAPTGATQAGIVTNLPPEYYGPRRYAVTFVTGSGETTPGPYVEIWPPDVGQPNTSQTTVYPYSNPTKLGELVPGATYYWAITYVDPTTGNETVISSQWIGPLVATVSGLANFSAMPYSGYLLNLYRTTANGSVLYLEQANQLPVNVQQAGQMSDAVLVTKPQPNPHGYVPGPSAFALSGIPLGPAGGNVTARKIYRTRAYFTGLYQLATSGEGGGVISNNTGTTFVDQSGATLGANAPVNNTGTPFARVPLTFIPTGDSDVSARNLYRRSAGQGLRFVAAVSGRSSTTYTDTTPNASLGAAPPVVSTAHRRKITLSQIPKGAAGLVIQRQLYRSPANDPQLKQLSRMLDNTATTFEDVILDSALGANAPTGNTAVTGQALISSIPLGAASVSSRHLYRTAANDAQLKLLIVIANNTTTTYVDANPDAALGANAPTSDLSGLAQPSGQVLAGSPILPLAYAGAPFKPTGGWCRIGAQTVRYYGISGNTLTGLPPTGVPGALLNTVRFGEHADAAPQLLGVTGLTQAAIKGITVSIWVQRDDLAAQADMIAIDAAQGRTSDGVYEYRISDERRAEPSLMALCDADLALFSRPIVTVAYATRDVKTKAGKTVVINLTDPPINATLMIQDVTVTEIDIAPGIAPRFTVTASSVRYSLEDLLRQMAATVGV